MGETGRRADMTTDRVAVVASHAMSFHLLPLTGLEFLPLLNSLDLSGNLLDSIGDLEYLKNCQDLRRLILKDNPVVKTDAEGLKAWLADNLPNVSCTFQA